MSATRNGKGGESGLVWLWSPCSLEINRVAKSAAGTTLKNHPAGTLPWKLM